MGEGEESQGFVKAAQGGVKEGTDVSVTPHFPSALF